VKLPNGGVNINIKNYIYLICIIMILFFTVSVSFANGEADNLQINDNSTDNSEVISVYNEIETENYQINEKTADDEVLSSSSDNDVLKASEVYVSPTGSSSGDGSQQNPYNWDTAYSAVDDGGTVYFLGGIYTNFPTKTIKKSINLIGADDNVIFDNAGGKKFFYFNPSNDINVKICNLTFTHTAVNDDGGAIDFQAPDYIINLDVKNCIFKNIKANYGAAFCFQVSSQSSLNVTDCTFINNTCTVNGGSIWTDAGNILFKNNLFINCSSSSGGAICFGKTVNDLKMDDVNFTNCSANYGGAIYFASTVNNFNLSKSYFNKCTAKSTSNSPGGGAIYFYGAVTNLKIDDVNFCNVRATGGNGGTIYFYSTVTNFEFINSNIINSSAVTHGGAIYVNGVATNFELVDSDIINSSAKTSGSAIYIATGKGVSIRDSCIENYSASSNGGVIYIGGSSSNYGKLDMDNVTFKNNERFITSGNGGIVYCGYASTVNISNMNFTNVSAAAGAAMYFGTITGVSSFTNVNFTNTESTNGGSAIYFASTVKTFNLSNSYFNNCTSKVASGEIGGAICFASSVTLIDCSNSSFIDVHANRYGSVFFVYNNVGTFNLSNSDFSKCTAHKVGMFIFIIQFLILML